MAFKKGDKPKTPPKKGEIRNPNGRPKKWITEVYAHVPTYSKSQIMETIAKTCSLNQDELMDIFVNPEATVLERTLARAVLNGMAEGDIRTMLALIERQHGKPTQEINIETIVIEKQVIMLPDGNQLLL